MRTKLLPVASGSGDAERCPIRDVLDCIGDKWSLLSLITLDSGGGTMRFTQLKRAIGDISQRMLAQTLRTLEREGYVSRKAYPTIPPKVEYSLTALGRSLLKKVQPLIAWADENHARVRRARKGYVPPAVNVAL